MFRLVTILGARPQFIKAAVVNRELQLRGLIEEQIIHTGQHYDYGMSQVFFDELSIPAPSVNLGISGGTHAQMTARMLVAIEEQLLQRNPDAVLVYGDTNSTLAAALAAAKLHIPVVHIEAGTRTHSMTNPEEINRICTDHVSGLLLACTQDNMGNLDREGLGDRAAFVGDPMYDAFCFYRQKAQAPLLTSVLDGSEIAVPKRFYYLTCHREENTSAESVLQDVLDAMEALDEPVVYPVHPRNERAVAECASRKGYKNIMFAKPVGYLESLYLVDNAVQVVTDSGGLQREAFFAGVKCTTLLDFEVWPETMVGNRNILAKPDAASICEALSLPQTIDEAYKPFGDGNASRRIADAIEEYLGA